VYSVKTSFGVAIDYCCILLLTLYGVICLQCDCNIFSKAGLGAAVYSVQNSFGVAIDYGRILLLTLYGVIVYKVIAIYLARQDWAKLCTVCKTLLWLQ
jgi:hypothetical protein